MRDRRRGAAENNKVTTARVILCLLEVFQLVLLYNLMERNGGEEPIWRNKSSQLKGRVTANYSHSS